ncbi:MAG: HIT family protein [Oligoflexia bacterium]|nr:HIT family protein [Oligoflexia bacterium]
MTITFSKIISGEAEASFVYRDNLVSAFMDIEPINPGHVLVVPNKVVSSVSELDDETAARIFVVARRIASAIRESEIPCEGINFFLADGEVAGQEVFHLHLHIVPRLRDDGFQLKFPDTGHFNTDRTELNRIAGLIEGVLGRAV